MLHLKCFSSEWICCWWTRNPCLLAKLLSHTWHWSFFSFKWTAFTCWIRPSLRQNDLSHCVHFGRRSTSHEWRVVMLSALAVPTVSIDGGGVGWTMIELTLATGVGLSIDGFGFWTMNGLMNAAAPVLAAGLIEGVVCLGTEDVTTECISCQWPSSTSLINGIDCRSPCSMVRCRSSSIRSSNSRLSGQRGHR